MKLGAEPKKIGIFVALIAVVAIVFWMNSSPSVPSAATPGRGALDPVASVASAPAGVDGINKSAQRRIPSGRVSIVENIYKVGPVDPGRVDPTLRLDLLAKVQAIAPEGGARNLFQISNPPPPPVAVSTAKIPIVGPIHPNAPAPVAAIPQPPPPPPGPPPINLKYYGYSTKRSDGEKKAFFLDGEDIIVASEGEIIKKQYKVLRIGVNSVQMEDTTSRTTQTLPIQPDAAPV